MSKIDEQIKQCEADIEDLQENLKQLKEQKKKEETHMFKKGYMTIDEDGCPRFMFGKNTGKEFTLVPIDNNGEEVPVHGQ